MKGKKKLTGYAVCLLFGTAIFLIVCETNGYRTLTSEQEKARILCDAFTIPGIMLVLGSGLVFAANHGAFYGIGYGLRTVKDHLLPFLPHEYVRYGDYIARKKEKKVTGYSFIFYTGLIFLVIAVILLIRFNILYPNA